MRLLLNLLFWVLVVSAAFCASYLLLFHLGSSVASAVHTSERVVKLSSGALSLPLRVIVLWTLTRLRPKK